MPPDYRALIKIEKVSSIIIHSLKQCACFLIRFFAEKVRSPYRSFLQDRTSEAGALFTSLASDTDGVVFFVTDNDEVMAAFGLEDGQVVAVRDVSGFFVLCPFDEYYLLFDWF